MTGQVPVPTSPIPAAAISAEPVDARCTAQGVGFTAVRIFLGLILLTAAGLKLYGLNVTALPRVGWFATPRVQVAATAWELLLGLWLLSGECRALAWLASIGTFVSFAVVSGYLGWTGVATCGCFGVIGASPWAAFSVDVAAIALLAFARPGLGAGAFGLPMGFSAIVAGAAATFIALTGVGSWVYGSPQAALARLRGELVTFSHDYVDFGAGAAGQVVEAKVEVHNWSDRPVRLVGGTSDCSCITTSSLPVSIPPGESRPVMVQLKIPRAKPGALTRTAELWTDQDRQQRIWLRVGCRIVEQSGDGPLVYRSRPAPFLE